jgi:hypothetical protein
VVILLNKTVICNWGSMKGKTFEVVAKLKNGNYSCILADKSNDKYYEYSPSQIEIK